MIWKCRKCARRAARRPDEPSGAFACRRAATPKFSKSSVWFWARRNFSGNNFFNTREHREHRSLAKLVSFVSLWYFFEELCRNKIKTCQLSRCRFVILSAYIIVAYTSAQNQNIDRTGTLSGSRLIIRKKSRRVGSGNEGRENSFRRISKRAHRR